MTRVVEAHALRYGCPLIELEEKRAAPHGCAISRITLSVLHDRYPNTSTTITVEGIDTRSEQETIPHGAAAYVQSVRVNVPPNISTTTAMQQNASSRCHFDFYDTFRVGADIVITVTADRNAANNCGASILQSISTGGFVMVR